MPDNYEANFEVNQPIIEITLELKQYVDKENQQKLVTLIYDKIDWVSTAIDYKIEIPKEKHGLSNFCITDFQLYEEQTANFVSALCDYSVGELDSKITLYSSTPCKCKIILFGDVVNA